MFQLFDWLWLPCLRPYSTYLSFSLFFSLFLFSSSIASSSLFLFSFPLLFSSSSLFLFFPFSSLFVFLLHLNSHFVLFPQAVAKRPKEITITNSSRDFVRKISSNPPSNLVGRKTSKLSMPSSLTMDTVCYGLSLSLTLTLARPRSLSLTLARARARSLLFAAFCCLSFTHSLTLSLYLALSFTPSFTCSLFHSLSLSLAIFKRFFWLALSLAHSFSRRTHTRTHARTHVHVLRPSQEPSCVISTSLLVLQKRCLTVSPSWATYPRLRTQSNIRISSHLWTKSGTKWRRRRRRKMVWKENARIGPDR